MTLSPKAKLLALVCSLSVNRRPFSTLTLNNRAIAPSSLAVAVYVTRCAYISLVFVYRVKGSSYARGGLVARALITAYPAARGVFKTGGIGVVGL